MLNNLIAVSGCDSTRTIRLTVGSNELPNLGNKNLLCLGDSIILSPGNFNSYVWQDGSTQKTFTVKNAGVYAVNVKSDCVDTTVSITIQESSCSVLFPSAFTPGNGGVNQTFRIAQGNVFSQYQLTVFNRYGEKVFESFTASTGWDGKFKGIDAVAGAYVWICNYKTASIRVLKQLKGTVVLLR